MHKLNRTIMIATILILVVATIVGPLAMQSAQASPTNPLLYPYNQPSGITFNINDITSSWTAYKNARLTTNGAQGGMRVLWDDGSSTVSEGMGYGMMFTSFFDEQSNFDAMWRYVSQHLDANGLLHWKIDSNGTVTGSGAATDGDEDIALGLVNACVKVQKGAWPASPSGYNYCTLATNMINAIYNTEVDKPGSAPPAGLPNNPGNELLPGDMWTTATQYPNGIVNLSYFSPGYFTVFGKFTNNLSAWEAVNTRNYAITNLAQSKAGNCSKLVPNWNNYNGDAQLVSWQTNEYGWWSWDAARFAWRVAVDKSWYNTPNAQETMNEIGGFFSSVGIANVKAQYRLDGTSVDSYDSAFFNGNAAAAIWAAPNPIAVNCGAATATLKSTPQQAYDKLRSINDTTSYYSAAWRLLSMMVITGNFPNIYELGQGTVTSTSTPTSTGVINTPTSTRTRTSTTGPSPTRTRTATSGPSPTRTNTPMITNTPTRTATATGACIPPTAIAFSVMPVTSPTSASTQIITISVSIGASPTVTVTSEAGTFTASPGGSSYTATVNLVPNSTNHLTVQAVVSYGTGCSYTLTRTTANNGTPLEIVQTSGGPSLTPTRTSTPTTGPSLTPTPTQPTGGACTPVTSTITVPFTFDGAGQFCWQAASLGGFINSWNTTSVSVNGQNVTNIWVGSGSYPAKINNNYYVSYNSAVAWGHFEVRP